MIYQLPSNNLFGDDPIPIELPDHWEVHVSEIQGRLASALDPEQIKAALDAPLGKAPIREDAKGKKSAVIIVDDLTRPTPCQVIANIVVEELLCAGVPKDSIWFVTALGAHGCMYRDILVKKLGEKIVEEFEVYNHNAFHNHTFVGTTSNGIPIEINSDVMSAEYKIAVGTVMPHSFYGFSGGAKAVLPGIASIRTIAANHGFASSREFNMGNPETRIRKDAEEAAAMMGLDFKIDVLLNGKAEISALFCGDFKAEAQAARDAAGEHYRARFVPDCDLVISNNYFKPLESNCSYTPETIASLKDGGDYVLSANSPYGFCAHFLYDKWGHTSPGGALFEGTYAPDPRMKHMIGFSQYSVKGMRDSGFSEEGKGTVFFKEWKDVIDLVDDGKKKKVVIYPMAECQILNNSKEFYGVGQCY